MLFDIEIKRENREGNKQGRKDEEKKNLSAKKSCG